MQCRIQISSFSQQFGDSLFLQAAFNLFANVYPHRMNGTAGAQFTLLAVNGTEIDKPAGPWMASMIASSEMSDAFWAN